MNKIVGTILGILLLSSFMAGTALAADTLTLTKPPIIPTGASSDLKIPGAGKDSASVLQGSVLPTFTNTVIGLTGGLSLLFVIISGIQILTAYGNEEAVGKGKKTLTFALIGLVISLLSYAIVQIIVSIKIK